MNLHDWMSNRIDVLNQIPVHGRAKRERMKILGFTWTVKEDYLALTNQVYLDSFLSKRTVLHQIASIYDPLGLLCAVDCSCRIFGIRKGLGMNSYRDKTETRGTITVTILKN